MGQSESMRPQADSCDTALVGTKNQRFPGKQLQELQGGEAQLGGEVSKNWPCWAFKYDLQFPDQNEKQPNLESLIITKILGNLVKIARSFSF